MYRRRSLVAGDEPAGWEERMSEERFDAIDRQLRVITHTLVQITGRLTGLGDEIRQVDVGLRGEMVTLADGLRGEIGALGASLRAEMKTLGDHLHEEMHTLHHILDAKIERVHNELDGKIDRVHEGLDGKIDRVHGRMLVLYETARQDMRDAVPSLDPIRREFREADAQLREDIVRDLIHRADDRRPRKKR